MRRRSFLKGLAALVAASAVPLAVHEVVRRREPAAIRLELQSYVRDQMRQPSPLRRLLPPISAEDLNSMDGPLPKILVPRKLTAEEVYATDHPITQAILRVIAEDQSMAKRVSASTQMFLEKLGEAT